MRRFWVMLVVVAVVGFALGSGIAYGRHTLKSGSPATQQVGASLGPATAPTAPRGPGQQPPTAAPDVSPDVAKPTPATQSPSPTAKPRGTATPGRGGPPTGKPGTGQAARNNLTGTIESIAGDSFVLAARQGSATVTLGRDTSIQQVVPASRADLQPGVTVSALASVAQGGGAVRAVMIGAQGVAPTFLLAMGGGLGQAGGGSGQRGAPVSGTVSQVSGDRVVVDTSQGQVTLTLGPDTVVQKVSAADRAALAAGSMVFVSGIPGTTQSAWTATTVVVMPAPTRQP